MKHSELKGLISLHRIRLFEGRVSSSGVRFAIDRASLSQQLKPKKSRESWINSLKDTFFKDKRNQQGPDMVVHIATKAVVAHARHRKYHGSLNVGRMYAG